MLKRKVFDELLAWKKAKEKKCLVVQGARQVGKTYAIEVFGRENYEEVVSLNFKEMPSASSIFFFFLYVETLVLALRFQFPDKKITPGKTLIFLDEIQECEEAVTSLKFWAIDNRYDVIASGSMLGIDYKRAVSYPVGYVNYIQMYGLDFEEFLWSQNISEDMIASLKKMYTEKIVVPEAVHQQMMNAFRNYIALGGMPEVVQQFVSTGDFRDADRVQRELLKGYLYDIAHYASAEEKIKAEKCFLSLTKQLLDKDNHKFQYKEVEKGAGAQKYYSSIDWLRRADIVRICHNVSDVHYDLEDYERKDNFRVYTTDLSLLIAMKEFSLKEQIVRNTFLGNTKGGIYECALADVLLKKEYAIYFYKNESIKKEVDFLIQKEGRVVPIEVKSGRSRAASLNQLMKKNPEIPLAYKFIDGNVGDMENGIISMPLYMAMFL